MVFRVIVSNRGFRPWATALAIVVLATTMGTQFNNALWEQPALTFALTYLREALGWLWMLAVALVVGRAAVSFAQSRARPGGFAEPPTATMPPGKRAPRPRPWGQVVERAVLITALILPRFLHDLPTGTVMAFWLVILLTCGYLALEGVSSTHHQRWYRWRYRRRPVENR